MGVGTPLRVGITLGLRSAQEPLWNNGIKQNALFLADALRHCPGVASVVLVNTTAVDLAALTWDTERWPTVAFEQAKDSLDLLIELGGQISADQTDYLKRRGARLVSYCSGSEYVTTMESVLFGKPAFGLDLFVNPRYDAIWMIPQVAELNEAYFTTLRRRPAQVVPFVWDPVLLTRRAAAYPHGGEYRPRAGPRRLSVFEPNINVVKFCLYPVFIAEEAFRQRPELIAFLHVTNAERLATSSQEFVALMNQLDIVRARKASFVGRFDTPQFLAEMTDVVIAHQWGNPLNYLYLEACWLGYPLVHNAALCEELGYFYAGHDVRAGCRHLLAALEHHDLDWEAYTLRQRRAIDRFLPGNPALTQRYQSLLDQLMQHPPI